jgi:putative PIN family toxin of toxin-antitoxin system
MRAVLDTNIVVSALIWGGKPFELLQAATDGDLLLNTSPALLTELRDVLARPHLAARLERQRSSVEQAITLYAGLAVSVTPDTVPRVVPDDVDDDQVIAATSKGVPGRPKPPAASR